MSQDRSAATLPERVEWVVFQEINGEWHQADAYRSMSLVEGQRELAEWREAHAHHSYRLVKRTITQEFESDA